MKNYLALLVFVLTLNTGFSQDVKSDMTAVVKYLASDKLEGRETGTKAEKKAAKYLVKQFKNIGLVPKGEDEFYQDFTYTPKANPHASAEDQVKVLAPITGRNVIGYIDNEADYTIIIGAHYDHLGFGHEGSRHAGEPEIHNGADDNASGVAVILELAKYLKVNNKQHNYLILAFSGEEKGLWGSNYYMKNPTIDTSKISYMINFDMVGRLSPSYKLAVYGTGTSPVFDEVLNKANDPVKFHLVKKESGVGPSDHTSFYLKGYPVLHFFTGQHEDYHKPTDDFEKINFDGMVSIVNYVENVMTQLDSLGKLGYQKTKDEESHKAPKYSVTLGVVPDYLFDGTGMRIDGVSAGKPAENAGIMAGDIVVKMGDVEVPNMMGYMKALSQFKKGQETDVVVVRNAKEVIVHVTF
jgi:hypothetical protein